MSSDPLRCPVIHRAKIKTGFYLASFFQNDFRVSDLVTFQDAITWIFITSIVMPMFFFSGSYAMHIPAAVP